MLNSKVLDLLNYLEVTTCQIQCYAMNLKTIELRDVLKNMC